ncbi:MAG: Bug family tripartite tricarboxylate transporter substrate binding protein [Noviherbaspirillum sp.]
MSIHSRLFALLAGILISGSVAAQAYPVKPITLVVPFGAGGNNDVSGRLLAQKMSEIVGQPVVVENRTGAAGAIGMASVAKAQPDGYTLGFGSSGPVATNVSLYKNLPYDPVKDFQPVARTTSSPSVLVVHPSVPARNIGELVAYLKSNPGKLNYATSGKGSSPHLAGALFESMAGVQMTNVAYRGGAPALADLMSGQVQLSFSPILEVMPHIASGKLRALGVTSLKRSALLPDVPAIAEIYPKYEVITWNGILAPKGVSPEVVQKIHAAAMQALADPEVKARLAKLGLDPFGAAPAEFGEYIRSQIGHFASLAEMAGVEAQ